MSVDWPAWEESGFRFEFLGWMQWCLLFRLGVDLGTCDASAFVSVFQVLQSDKDHPDWLWFDFSECWLCSSGPFIHLLTILCFEHFVIFKTLRQRLMYLKLVLNLLSRRGRPWILDPPVFSSQIWGYRSIELHLVSFEWFLKHVDMDITV